MDKCLTRVLLRGVPGKRCREGLVHSFSKKCWKKKLRDDCCGETLGKSVVEKCWEKVLEESVVEKCGRNMLYRNLGGDCGRRAL